MRIKENKATVERPVDDNSFFHKLLSDHSNDPHLKLKNALKLGCEFFGLSTGVASEIIDDRYIVVGSFSAEPIARGSEFQLWQTYCDIPYNSNTDVIAIHHMANSRFSEHPCYTIFKNEAYIGTKLFVDNLCYGMLSFSASYSVPSFSQEDERILVALSNYLGAVLKSILVEENTRFIDEQLNIAQNLGSIGTWEFNIESSSITGSNGFFNILGVARDNDLSLKSLTNFVHRSDRKKLVFTLNRSFENDEAYTIECRLLTPDGGIKYIQAKGKPRKDRKGNVISLIGIIQDTTKTKVIMQTLDEELEFKEVLSQISLCFNLSIPIEEKMESALELLGAVTRASRAYVFEDYNEGTHCRNTYEWCADNVSPQKGELQELSYEEDIPAWKTYLETDGIISCETIETLPKEIRRILEPQEIKSILVFPLNIDGKIIGFIGLDDTRRERQWSNSEGNLLETTANIISNILKQRAFALELEDKEVKYRTIFDNAQHFTGFLEPDGTVVDVNETGLEFLGKSIEDVKGVKLYETPWWGVIPEVKNRVENAVKSAAKGTMVRYEEVVVGGDGTQITIDFSITPILDEQGEIIYLLPEGRDITEYNALLAKLKTREKQLQRFVEQAPVAVAMLDTEMKYICASQKWLEEYNIKTLNIEGRGHYEIFPEILDKPEWLEDHRRVLRGESYTKEKDKFIREDGTVQWLTYKLIPWYLDEGTVGGMIMYTADVTHMVMYQEQLENDVALRTQELKEQSKMLTLTNQELESFSYSVSHDLRAPLRALNGFSKALYDSYSDQLDEQGHRWLEFIRSNATKMDKLVVNLLDYSKAARKELNTNEVDMYSIVKQVVEEEAQHYRQHTLNIKIEKLHKVRGDSVLLFQIWQNLVGNAMKYAAKNESIGITVASDKKEKETCYSITDNGIGFDQEDVEKIFNVFERLHTDEEYPGTGIGLATVRRMVQKHGGRIDAKSRKGHGATFYITFPN